MNLVQNVCTCLFLFLFCKGKAGYHCQCPALYLKKKKNSSFFQRAMKQSVHSSGKSSGLHRGIPIAIQTLMII